MPSASGCGEPFPALRLSQCRCHGTGDAVNGNRDAVNAVAGAAGGCGVPAAPAMAGASSQTPSLWREKVGQGRGWGVGLSRGFWQQLGTVGRNVPLVGVKPPPNASLWLQVLAKGSACTKLLER